MADPSTSNTAPKNDAAPQTDIVTRLGDWESKITKKRNRWRKEAKEAFDLVSGEQWGLDSKLRADMAEAGRITPTFNLIGPLLDAVSGAEIMNRQQVQYYPRQVGKAMLAEVLTSGAEWIRDRCDADMEESAAFRDSFTCGEGWTETLIDYEEDPQGKIIVEHVDPIEMGVDPSSRKANYVDARYICRAKPFAHEEFEARWPDALSQAANGWNTFTINDPRNRYNGDNDDNGDDIEDDEVVVYEWQWFDLIPVYMIADPDKQGQVKEIGEDDYKAGMEAAQAMPPGADAESTKAFFTSAVRQMRRQYWRAYECGQQILNNGGVPEQLDKGEFTYKCITGKRDRNRQCWYGLVRPMRDPQRWANQLLAQLLGILAVSAKGGLFMEADAAEDNKKFEEDYAKIGSIQYVRPGSLTNGAIKEKQAPELPQSVNNLMEFAFSSLGTTTGINPEMLGQVDREQAGVLEDQRKRAAYGLLSVFFDAFRRYRRLNGRLTLKFMAHLPPDYLVRIQGTDDLMGYIQSTQPEFLASLPKDPQTGQPQLTGATLNVPLGLAGDFSQIEKFDVIVDDAPEGPNQKAQAWGVIMQLMPYLMKANLPGEFWSEVAKYSPLPAALAQKMSQFISQAGPTPIQQAGEAAKVAKDQSSASKDAASAVDTLANAARSQAETALMTQPDDPAIQAMALAAATRGQFGSFEAGSQSAFGQPLARVDHPSLGKRPAPPPPTGDPTQ